jgi:RNA polymerase sigma-70 factor (ECF subfamily)
MVLPPDAAGRFRMVATRANGRPAFAAYQRDDAGTWRPAALHVLELDGDRIAGILAFLDPRSLAAFGLAPTL